MCNFAHWLTPYAAVILTVLPCISSQRYFQNGLRQRIAPVPPYPNSNDYNDNYDYSASSQSQNQWPSVQQQSFNFDTAIHKLKYSPEWVPTWPLYPVSIGQVSAVSIAPDGNVYVFHRGTRIWDRNTFTTDNRYWNSNEPPIGESTVAVFNSTSGQLVDQWGENLFYLPHGLTVDKWNNVWVTDVALHQVMKFSSADKKTPVLTLGTKFIPGNDDLHFCKPAAVAVMDSGEFFVADGYCNTRVIKYSSEGRKILQWGHNSYHGAIGAARAPPGRYSFFVPHSIALAEDKSLICIADRENGRILCFNINNGTYVTQFHSQLMGARLFAVAYTPIDDGRLYIVNGPELNQNPIRGFVINIMTGKILSQFGPNNKDFANPHDIAVSPDGREVYVVELDPYKVHKFEDASLPALDKVKVAANTTSGVKNAGVATDKSDNNATGKPLSGVKPTATVEGVQAVLPGGWNAWMGVAGGVAGGLGAVLICLVGTAALLARARRRGCLSPLTPRNRRQRWDFAPGAPDFKLRSFLERPRGSGFERVNTEESDEEPTPATSMLAAQNA